MSVSQPWIPVEAQLSATARSNFVFVFDHPTTNLPGGADIRFTVRRNKFSATPSIAVDGTNGIVVVGRTATVTVSHTLTDLPCGFYMWLLEATIAGQQVALAHGILDLSPSAGSA